MGLKTIFKRILKAADLFSSSTLLRYNDDNHYSTTSGGICSIIMFLLIITMLYSVALNTFTRQSITVSQTNSRNTDPPQMTLKIAPASPFVFAIGIMGLDLNDNTKRYFDISLISVHYSSGLLKDSVNSTDLVPCTIDHFSMSNSTSSDFNRLTSSKRWLCPPVNSTFTLRGRYTSTNLNLLQVTVTKCDPLLRGKPPCATDAVINQLQLELGTFTLNFLFVNPLINPSSQDYLGYYLEDRNYIAFTTSFGGYGNAFIGKYTINTDVSSLPFQSIVTDQGFIINQLLQTINFQVTDGKTYAYFLILEDSNSYTYTRSFNKLDSFFSYIGGLMGLIISAFMIIGAFTDMGYELQLCHKLFKDPHPKQKSNQDKQLAKSNQITPVETQKPNNSDDYGEESEIFFELPSYIAYLFYSFWIWIGCKPRWKTMEIYRICEEEIKNQLDIGFLIRRILFLERTMSLMVEQHELDGIHLMRRLEVKQAKKMREKYQLRNRLKKNKIESTQTPMNYMGRNSGIIEQKEKYPNAIDQQQKNSHTSINKIPFDNLNSFDENTIYYEHSKQNLQDKHNEQSQDDPSPQQNLKDLNRILRKLKQSAKSGDKMSKIILENIDTAIIDTTQVREEQIYDQNKSTDKKMDYLVIKPRLDPLVHRRKQQHQVFNDSIDSQLDAGK